MINKAKIFILIIIAVISTSFLLYIFIFWDEYEHVRSKVKDREKEVINIFKEHRDIIDFLEKEIYSYDDEFDIIYEEGKIKFHLKGNIKNINIDEEQEKLLISLFGALNYEHIRLRKEHSKKRLAIFLGDVSIRSLRRNNVYVPISVRGTTTAVSVGLSMKTLCSTG